MVDYQAEQWERVGRDIDATWMKVQSILNSASEEVRAAVEQQQLAVDGEQVHRRHGGRAELRDAGDAREEPRAEVSVDVGSGTSCKGSD